jgi:hypothetical protein
VETFRTLIRAEFAHSYFGDGYGHGIRLIPSEDTLAVLQRYGVILRQFSDYAVDLLADVQRMKLFLNAATPDEASDLVFFVGSTDRDCLNYTNVISNQAASNLRGLADGSITRDADTSGGGETSSQCSRGRACLSALGGLAPLARLRFSREVLLSTHLRDSFEPPLTFRIPFETTRSIWKYVFFSNYGARRVQVVDAAHQVTFNELSEEQLTNETKVQSARSTSTVPLAEYPTQRFQLMDMSASPPRVLIRRLPAAVPGRAHREIVSGELVTVSEIFINR